MLLKSLINASKTSKDKLDLIRKLPDVSNMKDEKKKKNNHIKLFYLQIKKLLKGDWRVEKRTALYKQMNCY